MRTGAEPDVRDGAGKRARGMRMAGIHSGSRPEDGTKRESRGQEDGAGVRAAGKRTARA